MNSQLFYLLFGGASTIQKNIFRTRRLFFLSSTCVNRWPAKNGFNSPLICVNINPLGWRNLMVRTTITNDVNQPVIGNVVYKPRDFIRMGFDDYFVVCLWINNPHRSPISINIGLVYIGLQIIQP